MVPFVGAEAEQANEYEKSRTREFPARSAAYTESTEFEFREIPVEYAVEDEVAVVPVE
ncbi:MAG: hypothetical protein QG650_1178 [Patescibacteria group bacterium]|nr:hypothetical protein [Patescibacteria group bacterium]